MKYVTQSVMIKLKVVKILLYLQAISQAKLTWFF